MSKPVVLVDMDSTIAYFAKGAVNKYISIHPNEPHIPFPELKEFYFEEEYGKVFGPTACEEMKRIYGEQGFILGMEPIEGAIRALNEMLAEGYEVFICTAPLSRFENNVNEKYHWVLNNMGRDWTRRIIMTRDKTLVHGDIIIDDKPAITGLMKPSWKHILFTQPYNLATEKPRITNWSDWRTVVESVLQSAN